MDVETKMWTYAGTGTKRHALVDGIAICNKNIQNHSDTAKNHGMDFSEAKTYGGVCTNCVRKLNAEIAKEEAFQARLEASMAPSTGEGDYHPPAETTTKAPVVAGVRASTAMREELIYAARRHENGAGVVAYATSRMEDALIRRDLITYDTHRDDNYPVITTKGWAYLELLGYRRPEDPGRVSLDEALAQAYPTETEENDTVTYADGPLTPRQTLILEDLALGHRYRRIADRLNTQIGTVRQEVHNIRRKFGAETTAQAVGTWRESVAYRRAAVKLRTGAVKMPVDEAENHVNHVLEGMAVIFEKRAEGMLPR